MKKRKKLQIASWMLLLMLTLSGCVKTVDQLYQLPRRSEGYHNLQAVMDRQMSDLTYSAPTSGENQQAVQIADLDQDGTEEVLLFARGNDECPLKIIIFRMEAGNYYVSAKLELAGIAFDQVEYIRMDEQPGLKIVVGTQLANEVLRKVSVFCYEDGKTEQLLSANYQKFLHCDLNGDGAEDLIVLQAGEERSDPGLMQMYTVKEGLLTRSGTVRLSEPIYNIKRVVSGGLSGGQKALFVASTLDPGSIVTDVFAWVDGALVNVNQGQEHAVHTKRSYYIYGEDIDDDGEMELPHLLPDATPAGLRPMGSREHLIQWYALTPQGLEVPKRYTYHNYQEGWYLELEPSSAPRIFVVTERPGTYAFYVKEASGKGISRLWTIYVLTGEDRSELLEENQFILSETDTEVYAAQLEPQAVRKGATEEMLCKTFHLIRRGWKTGEM